MLSALHHVGSNMFVTVKAGAEYKHVTPLPAPAYHHPHHAKACSDVRRVGSGALGSNVDSAASEDVRLRARVRMRSKLSMQDCFAQGVESKRLTYLAPRVSMATPTVATGPLDGARMCLACHRVRSRTSIARV